MDEHSQASKLTAGLLVLGALSGVAAVFFLPLYFVVPGFLAYLLLRADRGYMFAVLLVPILAAAILFSSDLAMAACTALLLIVPAGVIFFLQERKKPCFTTAAAAAGACIALLYALLCLPGILSGEGAFSGFEEAAAQTVVFMRETLSAAVPASAAPMAETYLSLLDEVASSVGAYVVPFLCSLGCVMALSNLLFFRLFARKQREALGLAPMLPFCRWSIPRSFTGGLFFLLIGSILLTILDADYAVAVSNTVTALVAFPLMVQGLSLIDFFLQRKKENLATKRTIVFTLLGLLFLFLQSALVMIGCFEQLFRIRERTLSASSGQTP